MAESLAQRVGRIVSGSLSALVAAVEDSAPELVMEQAVREVDAAIEEVRVELGRELAQKHHATTRLMEENRRHEDLAQKVEVALSEDREDLAHAAVSRQLDIEAQIPLIERTLTECGERQDELEGFIAALLARKREMEDELQQFVASVAPGSQPTAAGAPPKNTAGRADRAKDAFDRILSRNQRIPGTSGDLQTQQKIAELEEIARNNRIQERLAAAKAGRA
jgi:phage shock protein A